MGAMLQVHSYTSQHSPTLSPCLLLSGVGVTSDGVYTVLYTVLYSTHCTHRRVAAERLSVGRRPVPWSQLRYHLLYCEV